jgi:hypothetical protein
VSFASLQISLKRDSPFFPNSSEFKVIIASFELRPQQDIRAMRRPTDAHKWGRGSPDPMTSVQECTTRRIFQISKRTSRRGNAFAFWRTDCAAGAVRPVVSKLLFVSTEPTCPCGSVKLVVTQPSQTNEDAPLIAAIARGTCWFEELTCGKAASISSIASRENVTDSYISRLLNLALLSPTIVHQVLDGCPAATEVARHEMTGQRLSALWRKQASAKSLAWVTRSDRHRLLSDFATEV